MSGTIKLLRIGKYSFECGKNVYASFIQDEKRHIPNGRFFGAEDKHRHHFFGMIHEDDILNTVQNNNFNLCEVLTSYPKRLYFDVDAIDTEVSIEDILAVLKTHFNLKPDDVTIAGYITPEKSSVHIVAHSLFISNPDELERIKQLVKYVKSLGGICSFFDDLVYTKNRQMKCIFQSKPDKTVAMPLHPISHLVRNLEHYFISCYLPKTTPSYFKDRHVPTKTLSALGVETKPETIVPRALPSLITSNADMCDARKLLSITPSEQSNTHGHRWKVALFCFHNGLTEDDYLNWFYKSCPSDERIKKAKRFWTSPELRNPTYAITVQAFIRYLSLWYPDLTMGNHNTGYFVNSFDIGLTSTTIDRIEKHHFDVNEKAVLFSLAMGGGKTTATLGYLKANEKKSFIWLAPRQTLVLNTSHRMDKEFSLNHIHHLNVGADKTKLTKAKRLLICNQSLHYLKDEQRYDTVVIDEIETVLLSWLDEDTHGKNMGANFRRFCHLIRNASKIILLDAFITTKTIELLNSLDIPNHRIKSYVSLYEPPKKDVVINKDFKTMLNKIVDAIYRGEKSYIFYAYKNGTDSKNGHYGIVEFDAKIKELLRERRLNDCKTDAEKLKVYEQKEIARSLLYYAESKEKNDLGNINELWANSDYVMTTSSITVGVNYEGLDYHHVFILASGATNNPRDVIQSSMRIRKPISSDLNVYFFDIKTKDIKKFPAYFQEPDTIYRNLVVNDLREIQATFTDAFVKFCQLTNYKLEDTLTKLLANRRRETFVNDMFESRMLIEYTRVPEVDECKREEIEKRIYGRCASVEDRLTVERFYFDATFRNLPVEDRAYIWNTNSRQFFKGITAKMLQTILTDNKVDDVIKLNPDKLEINQSTIDLIKEHYSIINAKKPQWVLVKVLNDILGFDAITQKKDKRNKHKRFEFNNRTLTLHDIHERKIKLDEEEKKKAIEVQFIEDTKEEEYRRKLEEYFKGLTDDDYYWGADVHGDETWLCSKPRPKRDD